MIHSYPQALKESHVEEHFSISIEDPFRSLENDLSPHTISWLEAQQNLTEEYLNQYPYTERASPPSQISSLQQDQPG